MPNERNQLTRQAASPDTITDPAADWVASNWTLKAGQWGFETDTGQVKLGDGITPWNSLGYFGGGGGGVTRIFECRYQDPGANYAAAGTKVNQYGQLYPVAPTIDDIYVDGTLEAGNFSEFYCHPDAAAGTSGWVNFPTGFADLGPGFIYVYYGVQTWTDQSPVPEDGIYVNTALSSSGGQVDLVDINQYGSYITQFNMDGVVTPLLGVDWSQDDFGLSLTISSGQYTGWQWALRYLMVKISHVAS